MLEQKTSNYEVVIAFCPTCGAVCVEGHDNDGQIYCANCGVTFRPKRTTKLSGSEYQKMAKETKCVEKGGWTAFVEE